VRRRPETSRFRRGGHRGRPAVGAVSLVLIAAGALVLVWVLVTWRWQDPLTAIETWRQQGTLATQLRTHRAPARGMPVRLRARAYRLRSHDGEAMGRILIPRLGLDAVLVEGTNEADLAKGPGIYARDYLPAEGRLVYIAGHRTTHAAPFSQINALRRGDTITIRMPYGTFRYVVTRHRIVAATDVAVLRHGRPRAVDPAELPPPLLRHAPLPRLCAPICVAAGNCG
jgi:sortase A